MLLPFILASNIFPWEVKNNEQRLKYHIMYRNIKNMPFLYSLKTSIHLGIDSSRQDLVKFRNRKIRIKTFPIDLKCIRHLSSSAAKMSVKYQSDTIIITSNFAASIFHEIRR